MLLASNVQGPGHCPTPDSAQGAPQPRTLGPEHRWAGLKTLSLSTEGHPRAPGPEAEGTAAPTSPPRFYKVGSTFHSLFPPSVVPRYPPTMGRMMGQMFVCPQINLLKLYLQSDSL